MGIDGCTGVIMVRVMVMGGSGLMCGLVLLYGVCSSSFSWLPLWLFPGCWCPNHYCSRQSTRRYEGVESWMSTWVKVAAREQNGKGDIGLIPYSLLLEGWVRDGRKQVHTLTVPCVLQMNLPLKYCTHKL